MIASNNVEIVAAAERKYKELEVLIKHELYFQQRAISESKRLARLEPDNPLLPRESLIWKSKADQHSKLAADLMLKRQNTAVVNLFGLAAHEVLVEQLGINAATDLRPWGYPIDPDTRISRYYKPVASYWLDTLDRDGNPSPIPKAELTETQFQLWGEPVLGFYILLSYQAVDNVLWYRERQHTD